MAYGSGLENHRMETYREFESLILRHMVKRREGMHGESSYGVRTPEQCVFSGSNPDLTTCAGDNERRKQTFSYNLGHIFTKAQKYRLHFATLAQLVRALDL